MITNFLSKIVGNRNSRLLRQFGREVHAINAFEPALQALSDEQLRAKTAELRDRLQRGESLKALRPEAFAVVREAARRTLGQRHYDVQLIGGIVLHQG